VPIGSRSVSTGSGGRGRSCTRTWMTDTRSRLTEPESTPVRDRPDTVEVPGDEPHTSGTTPASRGKQHTGCHRFGGVWSSSRGKHLQRHRAGGRGPAIVVYPPRPATVTCTAPSRLRVPGRPWSARRRGRLTRHASKPGTSGGDHARPTAARPPQTRQRCAANRASASGFIAAGICGDQLCVVGRPGSAARRESGPAAVRARRRRSGVTQGAAGRR